MGSVSQIAKMKVFAVVLAAVASVSCDPYTVGQVAYGYGHPAGVITGVDYGHGLVSGVGAIGNRAVYAGLPLYNAALDGRLHNPGLITGVSYGAYGHGLGYYGKREAEAEPYTIGQVYAGLPIANAYATGHPHNVGYTAYVSHGLGYYGKREAEAEPYTIGQVYAGLPVANAY